MNDWISLMSSVLPEFRVMGILVPFGYVFRCRVKMVSQYWPINNQRCMLKKINDQHGARTSKFKKVDQSNLDSFTLRVWEKNRIQMMIMHPSNE